MAFLPSSIAHKLNETDLLKAQIGRSPIIGILMVVIVGKIQYYRISGNRKLIFPQYFHPPGVNAFPIYAVRPSPFGRPLHFTAPSVLIYQSDSQRGYSVVFPMKTPFIEKGNSVLKRKVCEIVLIDVQPIIKAVNI